MRRNHFLALTILFLILVNPAAAIVSIPSAFTPGNIVLSVRHNSTPDQLVEVTRTGSLVQAIDIPNPIGFSYYTTYHADLVVRDGKAYLMELSTDGPDSLVIYDSRNSSWTRITDVLDGGLNVNRPLVLEGNTAYTARTKFDLTAGTSSLFDVNTSANQSFRDMCLGQDGLLYGVREDARAYVVDPNTTEHVRDILLEGGENSVRSITVDDNLDLFVADFNGKITRYNAAGELLDLFNFGNLCDLVDIDLYEDGTIVVGSRDDDYFVTDRSLDSVQSLVCPTGGTGINVAFVTVPEPSSGALLLASFLAGLLVFMLHQRGR
ncbi:MAG: hypothetical protein JW818_17345 [Pirellulales bacterium]|nr:hypothetical protein [Pirellulales bacterium]